MSALTLGLSTFVLASPFSDADVGLFDKVRAFGYDQVEVCVEDPTRLTAPAVSRAAADAALSTSDTRMNPVQCGGTPGLVRLAPPSATSPDRKAAPPG